MRLSLGLCLLGSVLALLAASRSWSHRVIDHGPALPLESISRTGEQLAPGLRPLALTGLAAVVALLAARRWGRRLVGLIVLGCGVGICALSLADRDSSSHGTGWPLLSLLGGAVLAGGGVLALLRGHHWGGLSGAYRTPAARADEAPVTDKGVWDAFDRGEDPTADEHG